MTLEELKLDIKKFDQKAGWDKTEFGQLMEFMQEELNNLKVVNNKERVDHLLTDILVLIMQAAYRYNTDFSSELKKWFQSAEKEIV